MGVNKDQVQGRLNEAKGSIKELAGKIVGSKKLEAKGRVQKLGGKIESAYGDVKKDLRGWK